MWITLGLLILGIVVGMFLRGHSGKWVSAVVMATVCILLFVMGVRVGLNEEIIGAIKSTGVISAILFVFGTGCCIILTWLFTKYVIDRKKEVVVAGDKGSVETSGGGSGFKDSAIILGCFLLGLVLALTRILPDTFYTLDFESYADWVLYAMLLSVGISIGMGDSIVGLVKKLPRRVLWLPLVALAGTWIGSVVAFMIIRALGYDLSLQQSATINTAMGYYSLSSILTTKAWGATIGSICLLTNLLRELFTIIAAKPMGKVFGRFASTSSGGATVTDTSLPIILKAEGNEIMPAVLYFGIVINIAVPFLLTFLTM
ncbi:MAG: lysine exporter LysO family protein [Bacteroidales bacterium]|nr:lysine exporter LysO family protein [Bacteroidales bacterium]MBR0314259.1 lysine exporter LysO family protein [Bacteroidales bacterium]